MPAPLQTWQTSAINLAEHADNAVHTDEGAIAAGFPSALVAGTTVHAYLTHPPAAAWGAAWLDHGWSELRLLAPVFDRDIVDLVPSENDLVEARVNDSVRATLAVAMTEPGDSTSRTVMQQHRELTFDLADGLGDYGLRAGDELAAYDTEERAHPSVWPSIGNSATIAFYVDGPWVHVRSAISHLGFVARDAVVTVNTALIDRFETRAGERVVLDVTASVDGAVVARIEHESIIRLS